MRLDLNIPPSVHPNWAKAKSNLHHSDDENHVKHRLEMRHSQWSHLGDRHGEHDGALLYADHIPHLAANDAPRQVMIYHTPLNPTNSAKS